MFLGTFEAALSRRVGQ
ncbi:unnamed protein product, partial [Rotaria magnacalcarata]